VWLVVTGGAVVEDSVVLVVGGTAEAQALSKPIEAATTAALAKFLRTFISITSLVLCSASGGLS
jgi:hypothetical protein